MKQETETRRESKINGVHLAIIAVVVSFIASVVVTITIMRTLDSQVDMLEQETKVLCVQSTRLDYRVLQVQARLLGIMRDHIIQLGLDKSAEEQARVKEIYNDLAFQYNKTITETSGRFTSADSLPQGESVPLPREFKLYQL